MKGLAISNFWNIRKFYPAYGEELVNLQQAVGELGAPDSEIGSILQQPVGEILKQAVAEIEQGHAHEAFLAIQQVTTRPVRRVDL